MKYIEFDIMVAVHILISNLISKVDLLWHNRPCIGQDWEQRNTRIREYGPYGVHEAYAS